MEKPYSSPLTFELSEVLLSKLDSYAKAGNLFFSDVVRFAIGQADYKKHTFRKTPLRQLSVRLSEPVRTELIEVSNQTGASLGELLRVAIEDLPEKPTPAFLNQTKASKMAKKVTTKKAAKKVTPATKAPAKKAAAKKAAVKKEAAKKVAAKKAPVKKEAAKKVAVSKKATPAKKAVVKKVAAKKTAAKKAAVKKVAAKKTPAKKTAGK